MKKKKKSVFKTGVHNSLKIVTRINPSVSHSSFKLMWCNLHRHFSFLFTISRNCNLTSDIVINFHNNVQLIMCVICTSTNLIRHVIYSNKSLRATHSPIDQLNLFRIASCNFLFFSSFSLNFPRAASKYRFKFSTIIYFDKYE